VEILRARKFPEVRTGSKRRKSVQKDIAKTVRYGWRPEGKVAERMDLSAQARRLDRSLRVAEKWIEAAFNTETGELHARAEYTRDTLQEELARVCFAMEVEERKAAYGEEHEDKAEPSALSDALGEAFCILDRAPADLFNDSSPRARYALMGALMVTMDAPRPREPSQGRGYAYGRAPTHD
jgi:hypothetical protein